jgi:hypothetical protein
LRRIRREDGANQFLSQSDSDSDTSSQYVNIIVAMPLIDVSNCIPCILLSVNNLQAFEQTPPLPRKRHRMERNLRNGSKMRLQPGRLARQSVATRTRQFRTRACKVSSSIDIINDGWNIECKDSSRIRHIPNVHVENCAMILTNGWVSIGRKLANRYGRRATYMR